VKQGSEDNMTINYLLDIQNYTKCKKEQIPGNHSLLELLDFLCGKYGNNFSQNVFNNDRSELGEDIVILVNGKNVALSSGINTLLKDDDTIAILPAIMGG
jgi:Molybdopterin converting factor, small subunit